MLISNQILKICALIHGQYLYFRLQEHLFKVIIQLFIIYLILFQKKSCISNRHKAIQKVCKYIKEF